MKFSKPILIIVLCAVFSIIAGAGLRFYFAFHAKSGDIINTITKDMDTGSANYSALKEQGKFNILIMGEDDVEGSRRSDTILLATVDVDDKNVRVLSLPRDTGVSIPGHGTQKLNHAFAFGGPVLMKETIEKYLNIPILYYLVIDYDSFPALVDTMGGVEIDVQKKMRYVDRAGKLDINIQPGLQVMDGKQALHFVRFRKDALGDIGRVQRQQQFIKAIIKKAYDPRIVIKIPELTAQMMKLFKTDMSATLAVQLAGFVQNELGRERIFFSTLHGEPAMINRLSYWVGNVDSANAFLSAPVDTLISGDVSLDKSSKYAGISLAYSSAADESAEQSAKKREEQVKTSTPEINNTDIVKIAKSISESIAVLNGTGIASISQNAAVKLQKIGIDVAHTGNAKHFDYQYTNIIYPINASKKAVESAKLLGQLLHIPKNLIRPSKQAFYISLIVGHDYKNFNPILDNIVEIYSK